MNRRDQDRALKNWVELKRYIEALDPLITAVLLRGTFESGMRRDGEYSKKDPNRLIPPPRYSDETGETAIRVAFDDSVRRYVVAMADHIGNALNNAKQVLHVTPKDVMERAEQTIPNCTACGDVIIGRIRYGRWDEKCRVRFQRWVEDGNPSDEKIRFERMVQSEVEKREQVEQVNEWRVTAIDVLQQRGELPQGGAHSDGI